MSVQLAKRNLEVSVRESGFDWIVEVERGDDFTVRLWKGPQEFLQKNVSRGILEDESSPFRDKLIQDARLVSAPGGVSRSTRCAAPSEPAGTSSSINSKSLMRPSSSP